MKVVIILVSILAFVACLIIGIQAGSTLNHPPQVHGSDTSPVLTENSQRTILFILTDALDSGNTQIEGIWLLMYRPNHPHVILLPLYPVTEQKNGQSLPDQIQGKKFKASDLPGDAIKSDLEQLKIQWTGYIVVDEAGLSELINWIGSEDLGTSSLDGTGLVNQMVKPWQEVSQSLADQKNLADILCNTIGSYASKPDITNMFASLMPAHLQTDLGLQMVLSDWKSLTNGSQPLSCEINQP